MLKPIEAGETTDCSPLVVNRVRCGSHALHFEPPLVLQPILDTAERPLSLEYPELDIYVFASTREQLLEELNEQICMLWVEYALEEDGKLSPPARQLKHRLLQLISEETLVEK